MRMGGHEWNGVEEEAKSEIIDGWRDESNFLIFGHAFNR